MTTDKTDPKSERKANYIIIAGWAVIAIIMVWLFFNWGMLFPEQTVEIPINKQIEGLIQEKNAGNQILSSMTEIPACGNPADKLILEYNTASVQEFINATPANEPVCITLVKSGRERHGLETEYNLVNKNYWTFARFLDSPFAIKIQYEEEYSYSEYEFGPQGMVSRAYVQSLKPDSVVFIKHSGWSDVSALAAFFGLLLLGLFFMVYIGKKYKIC